MLPSPSVSPTFRKMVSKHVTDLEKYLAEEAKGNERFEARFHLVNCHMMLRQFGMAKDVLKTLDSKTAPAMQLLNGALWAERLQMKETRGKWIEAAVAKPRRFAERMEVATFLMTRLVEVKRAEQMFAKALKAATDDKTRSKVLWHRA